jgi:hypothetical protein
MPFVAVVILAMACAPSEGNAPAPAVVPAAPTVTVPIVVPSSTPAPPTTTKSVAKSATSTKSKTASTAHSKAACLQDENQCYEPGTNIKCQTGGCVNAARGLTASSIESGRQEWLRLHPGWCAVGSQGAVAPC